MSWSQDGDGKNPNASFTQTRHSKGEWFSIVPGVAVFDQSLTDGELRALAAAAALAGRDRICRTSQEHIANRLGVFRQSVNRWFRSLEEKGYLRVVGQSKRRDGARGTNVYRIAGHNFDGDRFGSPVDAESKSE